jgi:signal transduction histidine kinase
MKTWPLRWQITLWAALITGLALAAFGSVVAFMLYSQQVEAIDAQLATDAGLVLASHGGREELMMEDLARLTVRSRGEYSLHGFAIGNRGEAASVRARPEGLASLLPPQPADRRFFSVRLDRKRLRIGVFAQGRTTLLLAASLHPAEESVDDLLEAYLLAFPLVLVLAAGGSWWIARRALLPVTAITDAAASITADHLDERLPVPATKDEIGRLVQVLNGMFDRLQRSFEQANRFTADAAHELRTPLTIMRGQIEEAFRSGSFNSEQERVLVGLLEETTGLQKIADNLLLLARFDTDKSPLQLTAIDFSALVREAGEDAELLAAPREISISAEITPDVHLNGDPVMLRRVLLNLLDNAVRFNREKGRLSLLLRVVDSKVVLTIGNTGPGIPAKEQSALFGRFFRIAADRNRDTGGSGLGLSLCREIVNAHGGRIELVRSDPDWTEFTVSLPRLSGPPAPAQDPFEKAP